MADEAPDVEMRDAAEEGDSRPASPLLHAATWHERARYAAKYPNE